MQLSGVAIALKTMTGPRAGHRALLTNNGHVLVLGGSDAGHAALDIAELYVPATAAEMFGQRPF
jgi:hypothetical protein